MSIFETEKRSSPFRDEYVIEGLKGDEITNSSVVKQLDRDLATYSDEVKEIVRYRVNYLTWVSSNLKGGWTKKNLEPLIEKAACEIAGDKPSWRTLARWWRRYKNMNFSLVALAPKEKGKGNYKSRLTSIGEDSYQVAVARYLTKERPSIASAYQYYNDCLVLENERREGHSIPILSYNGFYKRIKRLPPYEVAVARHGRDFAEKEYKNFGELLPPTRILERVEIDHTPLNLILLDDKLNVPLGRPYLTLLIDSFSSCIVGFYYGFKEPSYHSVCKAIKRSILPKTDVAERFPDIEHDWPCFGKFENLVVDNGAEFWSENLELLCKEVHINVLYNPTGKPWLKPMVERFFGTIESKLLVTIPGKTFSNILQRERYNPAKDAVMHFSSFNEIFHKWIIDVHHFEPPSRRLKLPPYKLWQQSFQKLPVLKPDADYCSKLNVVLGRSDYRTLRKGGVHLHCLTYDSPKLSSYRKRFGQDRSKKYLIKTDESDISTISIFLDEIKEYLTVPCNDPVGYTKGLSLFQHDINLRLQRAYVDSQTDVVSLARARMYIHKRIEKEAEELQNASSKTNVKSTARHARYNNINSEETNSLVPEPLPAIELPKNNDSIGQKDFFTDEWDNTVSDLDPF